MGVPGLVAWLIRKYDKKSIIKNNIYDSNSYLFIDGNCLIHPQAKLVCSYNNHLLKENLELLEYKIIVQIVNYIKLIIDIINPKKLIYIAIDGVAPMAKIKHQRLRRFKTIYDIQIKQSIADKYNIKLEEEWFTASITPGTLFMKKLNNYILTWIENSNLKNKIIYSSCYTPGEGEHKILQYIKKNNFDLMNIIIYGLDADLLFLSLASEKKNIYLMREDNMYDKKCQNISNQFNNSNIEQKFNYLSIDKLKYLIVNNIFNLKKNKDKLINDFVFLCFFCGNDFIPNIPSLNIKPYSYKIIKGLDSIINIYTDIMRLNEKDEYLINIINNSLSINIDVFMKILEGLKDMEVQYYHDHYNNFKLKSNQILNISNSNNNLLQQEINYYENNIIDGYIDNIELGNPTKSLFEWKKKYYKYYFNINIKENSKQLDNVLEDYINGLIWTLNYYYDECKDYEWYFQYHHGPFISDLYNFIKYNREVIRYYERLYSLNSIRFENRIKPIEQLLLVLPRECIRLLPLLYRDIILNKKLDKYFPNILDIKVDYLYKDKAWQNILMLNIIPPNIILNMTLNIKNDNNILYKEYNFN